MSPKSEVPPHTTSAPLAVSLSTVAMLRPIKGGGGKLWSHAAPFPLTDTRKDTATPVSVPPSPLEGEERRSLPPTTQNLHLFRAKSRMYNSFQETSSGLRRSSQPQRVRSAARQRSRSSSTKHSSTRHVREALLNSAPSQRWERMTWRGFGGKARSLLLVRLDRLLFIVPGRFCAAWPTRSMAQVGGQGW